MTVLRTIREGLRQAVAAPRVLFLLWLVNVLFAVPVSLMIREALSDSFGSSLVAHTMRDGFDRGWHAEFESQAGDLEKTFRPTLTGPGPMLDNLEAWWSGDIVADAYPGIVGLGVGYAVLWAFLLGGVLDYLARPEEPLALDRFFGAAGRTFPRFLGLAVLSGVAYALIYALGRKLYGWIEAASRDVTVEKTVLLQVLAASALVVLLLVVVRMIFDYAKIAAVLEDRGNITPEGGQRNVTPKGGQRNVTPKGGQRNTFEIAWEGLRFVLSRPLATLGVTFGFGVLGALLFVLYLWLAPGAGQSTLAGIGLAFLLSQLYLVARLAVRLGLLAGQMSLYRSAD